MKTAVIMSHIKKEKENLKEYHISITNELNIIKDRVRNLIRDRHWGEDGRHKESALRHVLGRFMPENITIGTGFIVRTQRISTDNHTNCKDLSSNYEVFTVPSRQIDVIIFDNSFPVLFQDDDFFIVDERSVKGIIEVKTNFKNTLKTKKYTKGELIDIIVDVGASKFIDGIQWLNISEDTEINQTNIEGNIEHLIKFPSSRRITQESLELLFQDNVAVDNTVGITEFASIIQKANKNGELCSKKIFNGVFYYESDDDSDEPLNYNYAFDKYCEFDKPGENKFFKDALQKIKFFRDANYVNHISLGPNIFIKFWPKEPRGDKKNFFRIYKLEDMGFSFFISNAVNAISANNGIFYNPDLLFPIDKERFTKKDFVLELSQKFIDFDPMI